MSIILSFLNGETINMTIPIPFSMSISSGLQVGIWITDFAQNARMITPSEVIYRYV
ncbi:MAG: hypothetical protein PHC43_09920 [Candidatus Marinimicrobia bacterium]|nr:hypothetical protein [Candidatus Neomarinimicrobiota bacterium]